MPIPWRSGDPGHETVSDTSPVGRPPAGWIRGVRLDGDELQISIVEAATVRIRDEIMSGRIRPGERIRLDTLKRLLGVSHIPIREALRRLEGEGLVKNIPQRGAVATRLTLKECAEVYDLRKLIEPVVAARALPIGRGRLAELDETLKEMEAITDAWHSPDFAAPHERFHWLILERGANRTIEQVLRQLWQTSQRYIVFAMTTVERSADSVADQHRRLLRAVKRGDGQRVAREIKTHLEQTESATREALHLLGLDDTPALDDSTLPGTRR